MQRLQKVSAQQVKYYNINHQSKSQKVLFCQTSVIELYNKSRFSSTDRGRKNNVS